jgi:hypothetical protein
LLPEIAAGSGDSQIEMTEAYNHVSRLQWMLFDGG